LRTKATFQDILCPTTSGICGHNFNINFNPPPEKENGKRARARAGN